MAGFWVDVNLNVVGYQMTYSHANVCTFKLKLNRVNCEDLSTRSLDIFSCNFDISYEQKNFTSDVDTIEGSSTCISWSTPVEKVQSSIDLSW